MGIPDHLTCLLRNLNANQEATVRTLCGTTNWFKIGKGICQGYILSSNLFNVYAEYIIRNARLDESQAGIKIARRNINNLRFAAAAAAAAKSLQSCLTLCNPIDGSPQGSPVPGILQARTLEWVAISFSNAFLLFAIRVVTYADDTTLIAKSKEELKNLLMRVKEESEKAGLKLNFQKTKMMECSPITSC